MSGALEAKACAQVMDGPEYFYCEARKCRMRRALCLKYQRLAAQARESFYFSNRSVLAWDRALTCLDCKQGREIWAEMVADETPRPEKKVSDVKRCTKCGRWLPMTAFHRHYRSRDGRAYSCKECTAAYTRRKRKEKGGRK